MTFANDSLLQLSDAAIEDLADHLFALAGISRRSVLLLTM